MKVSKPQVQTIAMKKSEKSEAGIECEPCGEGVSARIAKLVSLPLKEEVEAHNGSHVPYRSWCPHCVNGKGKGWLSQEARCQSTHSADYINELLLLCQARRGN